MTLCYRKACRTPIPPGEAYYNRSTRELYCFGCAKWLNDANREDAQRLYGGDLCVKLEGSMQTTFDQLQVGDKFRIVTPNPDDQAQFEKVGADKFRAADGKEYRLTDQGKSTAVEKVATP